MPYTVGFDTVSTAGLESSPVAPALAGLRAHEARYFKTKYNYAFTVEPAANAKKAIGWVERILKQERDIVIASRPLEATAFQIENIRMAFVFYENGLAINVMYTVDDPNRRAVGFKLYEGIEGPSRTRSEVQVCQPKVKISWRHSRFVLRIQGRLLAPHPGARGFVPYHSVCLDSIPRKPGPAR